MVSTTPASMSAWRFHRNSAACQIARIGCDGGDRFTRSPPQDDLPTHPRVDLSLIFETDGRND